jgi:SAM-dependent methyltransferase
MPTHAMLLLPSANRVYADAAVGLTLAELSVFNDTVLESALSHLEATSIAGVPYVTFTAALSEAHVAHLARASAAYALFALEGDLLRPIPLPSPDRFDDDLVTIQKYAGKTNEQFTKLLLNVTVLASGADPSAHLRVLDPLCGRGTTLNQALMYGHDAAGIDLDGKDFEAYAAFIQTYLKRKRIKHRIHVGPVRREKRTVAKRLSATIERGATALELDVVHADTTKAREFHKPGTFDVIVTDAPYGVQHGSRTVAAGLRRGPLELLTAAAPVWATLLRPGGGLGLAWNTHVASRDDAAAVLTDAGLTVLPLEGFRHRVDQSITRDILVAVNYPRPTPIKD